MSLDSWKEEFYRTPAHEVSKRWALMHSINKWTGLLRRNRRKHKVHLNGGELYDDVNDESLRMNALSCALCHHHTESGGACKTCPVVKKTGETCHIAYGGIYDGKVAPMLRLLKKAKNAR